jgi:hypothetical protein
VQIFGAGTDLEFINHLYRSSSMLEVGNSEGLPRSVVEFEICLFRANMN